MKLTIYTKHGGTLRFENLKSSSILTLDNKYRNDYSDDSIVSIDNGNITTVISFKEISYYEITMDKQK